MLAKEIQKYIQEPILAAAGWSDASSKVLIYGTGYVETEYAFLMQEGTPANGGVGFYQVEPSDYASIIFWLKNGFNKNLTDKVISLCNFSSIPEDINSVIYSAAYATLVCRIHYHRIKEPLPNADDALGMAQYHLKYYNGNGLGKADVEKNTGIFQRIINNEM
jgi:hypothetical protein